MSGSIDLDHARAPDGMRLYAVGDVHGRLDLLQAMHEKIAKDRQGGPGDWRVIHLGDYVDRGLDSSGVLRFLSAACRRDPRNLALAGNHDIAFVEFLSDVEMSSVFRRFGGLDTARSYGVDFPASDEAGFRLCHERLVEAVPPDHVQFLLGLGFSLTFGDFFFCHAGIRPGISLARQSPDDLLWIRDEFLRSPLLHPKVVVHGHTPVAAPEIRQNRIGVDTGAFQTGLLSAVVIEGGNIRFLHVHG